MKFQFHLSYLIVLFGVIFFARSWTPSLVKSLLLLYVSFNVLLYGGIYTLNDVADIDSDRRHPLKKRRPLPSEAIRPGAAVTFALALIVAGLGGALVFFGAWYFLIFLIFLALNGLYSWLARDIPYLELIVNSSTQPPRFMMGVALTGREVPLGHLLAIYSLAFGMVCLRRLVEMDVGGWEARRTLLRYSRRELSIYQYLAFAAMIALFAWDSLASKGFYLTLISGYVVLICGAQLSSSARRILRMIWTR